MAAADPIAETATPAAATEHIILQFHNMEVHVVVDGQLLFL